MSFPISADPKAIPAAVLVETSLTGRSWTMRPADEAAGLRISQLLGVPGIVGRLLAARLDDVDAAERFLTPRLREWMPDPMHLLGMDVATARLVRAVRTGEKVGIIGDYDVDGATSTALLARYLEQVGVTVEARIPDRLRDGYGPNARVLDELAAAGCRLVMVLDAGTTAFDALEHAAASGLEVIVVDHHSAEAELPRALAVINPNRQDQESTLGDLAAVGVTFMLLVALSRALREARLPEGRPAPDLLGFLDLVALGTICDVVPLSGLNRAFVAQGLKVAAKGGNPGFRALCEVAGHQGELEAWHCGFVLGPRINAGGRLGDSSLGTRLLRTADPAEALAIATELDGLNAERQRLERLYTEAATAQVEAALATSGPVLVAHEAGWHPGVIGIVASRLAERFERPVFVIGFDEAGTGKGSGRSLPGFDMGAAVIAARKAGLLEAGGGHPMAAGLTVTREKIQAFTDFMTAQCAGQHFAPAGPRPLSIDAELSLGAVTLDLAKRLESLAPFGAGNPEPRFCLGDVRIAESRIVGNGHVSCHLATTTGSRVRAIAFRASEKGLADPLMRATESLRLAGRIRRDSYKGQERVTFQIEDAAPA